MTRSHTRSIRRSDRASGLWSCLVVGAGVVSAGAIGAAAVGAGAAAASAPLEALFPAGALHGVHGLAFDAAGRLLAAESWGMAVHRIDPASGRIETLRRGPDAASDDVGELPPGHRYAGTVVWSANFLGRVMARDADGTVRTLARDLPGINTIVIAPGGRVLATQTNPPGRLLEIDPAGQSAPRLLFEPTGGLNGFAIGDDGVIVGPQQDADLNRIVELDPATRALRVIADGLAWPTGVKRAPTGEYFAVDLGAGRVLRIDRSGATPPATVAQFDPGLDNLAVAPDGHVYVSHIPTSSIWDVDPRTGARRAVVQGHFGVPGGLACRRGPGGDELYLADVFTVKRIDVATRQVTTLVPLDRRSPFPSNVTLAGEHLVASSLFGGTVVVYDRASGRELRRLKGLKAPHDAVELDDGRLLVAEAGARQLTLVARDADQRTRLGDVDEEFMGLARDAAGHWHAGTARGVLYRIDLATARLMPVAAGLGRIEGLATVNDGRSFLVVDAASATLREVTPASGSATQGGATAAAGATVRTRAASLPIGLGAPPELPPGRLFHGVAAGDCRDAYLASDRDATLYRVAPRARAQVARKSTSS